MSEDVLEQYEFHVRLSEEDVRDGDATPWERVVAAFASTIRELRARVAELEIWLRKDDEDTWYCRTCPTPCSRDEEGVCGDPRRGPTP